VSKDSRTGKKRIEAQKTKNTVFDSMISGKTVNNTSPEAQKAIQTFTDIAIMEQFGRSYQDLCELPLCLYDDVILILNKQNEKQKQMIEESKRKSSRF
jgi:hypothetical protein